MRVVLRFIPGSAARFFGFNPQEIVDLPDSSRYRDLIKVLEDRFKAMERSGESLLEYFVLLVGGEPIARRLEDEIDPNKEVKLVMMAFGG